MDQILNENDMKVPQTFIADLEEAKQHHSVGKLRLLAREISGFAWEAEGKRLIGEALSLQRTMDEKTHYLLFTGHMIDKEGRKEPRFPAFKESAAAERILDAIKTVTAKLEPGSNLVGIAGGANGGDILFLEACVQMNIPAQLLLLMPREEYINTSVSFAGQQWVDRFDQLYADPSIENYILYKEKALPAWLDNKPGYSVWERNNSWGLEAALVNGGEHMTLIALWDGKGGDGPGGTEDMINQAKARGANVIIIGMDTI